MPGENLSRCVWSQQTKFTYNHWLAELVKGKCSSTKPTRPTRLATGVVCHPDTERNRPYKIPWPCWELNRGPTALQARTLPVCHTTHYTLFVCLFVSLFVCVFVLTCFKISLPGLYKKCTVADTEQMWQNQGEWVTCQQHSNLIFNINHLSNPIPIRQLVAEICTILWSS